MYCMSFTRYNRIKENPEATALVPRVKIFLPVRRLPLIRQRNIHLINDVAKVINNDRRLATN